MHVYIKKTFNYDCLYYRSGVLGLLLLGSSVDIHGIVLIENTREE